jgi:hypothetical protein
VGAGDKPVDKSDARAIQSAVQRATGGPPTAGGLAAAAMSAADLNPRVPTADKTTLADILMVCSLAHHHRLPAFNLARHRLYNLWHFLLSRLILFSYTLWLELI